MATAVVSLAESRENKGPKQITLVRQANNNISISIPASAVAKFQNGKDIIDFGNNANNDPDGVFMFPTDHSDGFRSNPPTHRVMFKWSGHPFQKVSKEFKAMSIGDVLFGKETTVVIEVYSEMIPTNDDNRKRAAF